MWVKPVYPGEGMFMKNLRDILDEALEFGRKVCEARRKYSKVGNHDLQ